MIGCNEVLWWCCGGMEYCGLVVWCSDVVCFLVYCYVVLWCRDGACDRLQWGIFLLLQCSSVVYYGIVVWCSGIVWCCGILLCCAVLK